MVTDLTRFCDKSDNLLGLHLEHPTHIVSETPLYPVYQERDKAKNIDDYGLLLSVSDVQEALGIGRNSTYTLLRSGKLKSIRVGRLIKIPRAALEEYLQSY